MKSPHDVRRELVDRTLADLEALATSRRPIVIGPWLGEIGFELLYWIPFLRWARTCVDLPADRLTVLSRGGCAGWYADITPHYRELYDVYTPNELRVLNIQRVLEQGLQARQYGLRHGFSSLKQYHCTSFEQTMLTRITPDAAVWHPGMMYRLFRQYWRGRAGDVYAKCAIPARMPAPPRPADLPEKYVAVKFYTSRACRERPSHQQMVTRILTTLASTVPVVLLDTGAEYDAHGSFLSEDPAIIRPALEPSTNLAVQTAIIAHASAFVGTYGGFAYLAPLLGVPTVALWGDRNFRNDHYHVAQRVCTALRSRFTVCSLKEGLTVGRQWRRWAHAA